MRILIYKTDILGNITHKMCSVFTHGYKRNKRSNRSKMTDNYPHYISISSSYFGLSRYEPKLSFGNYSKYSKEL